MKIIATTSLEWHRLCARQLTWKRRIEDRVRQIVHDVRQNGDEALLRYTRRFDRVRLTPKQLLVTEAEISGAFQHLDPKFSLQLKSALQNVQAFYGRPRLKPVRCFDGDGVVNWNMLGQADDEPDSRGDRIGDRCLRLVWRVEDHRQIGSR